MKQVESESLPQLATRVTREARMVLPGVQALLGFQLVGVLDTRFELFGEREQQWYIAALVLIAVAMGLVMAPAAYQRIAEFDVVSRRFIVFASIALTLAMAPLGVGICIDLYLISHLILGRPEVCLTISLVVGLLLVALWFVLPLAMRLRRLKQP